MTLVQAMRTSHGLATDIVEQATFDRSPAETSKVVEAKICDTGSFALLILHAEDSAVRSCEIYELNGQSATPRIVNDIPASIAEAVIAPQGDLLAVLAKKSEGEESAVHIFDIGNDQELSCFSVSPYLSSNEMTFSRNGRELYISERAYDIASGTEICSPLETTTFTSDGWGILGQVNADDNIWTLSGDGRNATVWNRRLGTLMFSLDFTTLNSALVINQNGTTISGYGRLTNDQYGFGIWDASSGTLRQWISSEALAVSSIIEPDRPIATSCRSVAVRNGLSIRVATERNGEFVVQDLQTDHLAEALGFSNDGRFLLVAYTDRSVHLYAVTETSTDDMRRIGRFDRFGDSLPRAAISRLGEPRICHLSEVATPIPESVAAYSTSGDRYTFFNVETGEVYSSRGHHNPTFTPIAFLKGGLCAIPNDWDTLIFDWRNGKEIARHPHKWRNGWDFISVALGGAFYDARRVRVCASPSAFTVATVYENGDILVIDALSGAQVAQGRIDFNSEESDYVFDPTIMEWRADRGLLVLADEFLLYVLREQAGSLQTVWSRSDGGFYKIGIDDANATAVITCGGVYRSFDLDTGKENWSRDLPISSHLGMEIAFTDFGWEVCCLDSRRETLLFIDAISGKQNSVIEPNLQHGGRIDRFRVSKDFSVISILSGQNVKFYDRFGKELGEGGPTQHNQAVRCVAFSPDSRRLASGGEGGEILAWGPQGTPVDLWRLGSDPVESLLWRSSTDLIAVTSVGSVFSLHNAGVHAPIFQSEAPFVCEQAALNWTGDKVYILGSRSELLEVDIFTGCGIGILFGTEQPLLAAHLDDFGNTRVFPSDEPLDAIASDGSIHPRLDKVRLTDECSSGVTSSSGSYVACARGTRTAQKSLLCRTTNSTWGFSRSLSPWVRRSEHISSLSFSSHEELLLAGTSQGHVFLVLPDEGSIGFMVAGHLGAVNAFAFSQDGRVLATASDDSTILLWDLETVRRSMRND